MRGAEASRYGLVSDCACVLVCEWVIDLWVRVSVSCVCVRSDVATGGRRASWCAVNVDAQRVDAECVCGSVTVDDEVR